VRAAQPRPARRALALTTTPPSPFLFRASREAAINNAEGQRRSTVLAAQGEAEAILARAHASSAAVEMLSTATSKPGAQRAVALRVAEQYVSAFGNIARKGNTLVIPADAGNVSGMVATALSVFNNVMQKQSAGPSEFQQEQGVGEEGSSSAEVTQKMYQDALKSIRGANGDDSFDYNQSDAAAPVSASLPPSSSGISSEEAAERVATAQEARGKFVPAPFPSS
jgi:C-terminal region of band_7